MKRMRCLLMVTLMVFGSATLAQSQTCTASSAGVNFGIYDTVSGSPDRVTGTLSVTCPSGTAYYVNLSDGLHQGANYQTRMASGGNFLTYTLYREASHASRWGNSYNFDGVAGTGTGTPQSISVYGQAPAAQTVPPGSYTDSSTVTVRNGAGTASLGTATFPINATVNPSCTISAAPLAFGVYTGARLDGTATVTARCTNTTAYQIGADNGQNSQFIGVYAKYMIGPAGNFLRYHLYTDAAHSIEWGTTAGTNEIAGTGNGVAQTITVYGTVGAGSYGSAPGSYSDIVTVTLTY